jgi:hypothetical protein
MRSPLARHNLGRKLIKRAARASSFLSPQRIQRRGFGSGFFNDGARSIHDEAAALKQVF